MNETKMPSILDLSKKIERKVIKRIILSLFVFSLALSTVFTFVQVESKINAIVNSVEDYLLQLIEVEDFIQVAKQLNSIVKNRDFDLYRLRSSYEGKVLASFGDWPEPLSPGLNVLDGKLEWVKVYNLALESNGENYILEVVHPIPYLPFFYSFFISLSFMFLLIVSIQKGLRQLAKVMNHHILEFTDFLNKLSQSSSTVPSYNAKFKESQEVTEKLIQVTKKMIESEKKVMESDKKVAMAEMARKVSHDIMSPIYSMKNLLLSNAVNEELRVSIRKNISRVEDIANILRLKNPDQSSKSQKVIFLDTALSYILSEKRSEYLNKNISIELSTSQEEVGLFAKINSCTLSSIISNLINNSIEAKANIIDVKFYSKENLACIEITDNGSGVDVEIQDKIFQKDFSSNKKGTGFGLYSAKLELEKVGGHISFASPAMGEGAAFTISVPSSYPPAWYVKNILVTPTTEVIILDDESFIHDLWKKSFGYIGITPKSFKNYLDFSCWFEGQGNNRDRLFLIDFELIGQDLNGIEIIDKFQLQEKSILVSSRADDEEVIEKCENLKIKLLPKELASTTPIVKQDFKKKTPAVFLDDDKAFLKTVSNLLEIHNLEGATLSTIEGFEQAIKKLPKDSFLFIDSNLEGQSRSGECLARDLYHQGHKNIYLMTGYDREDFPDMYWIKDIVGKEFPKNILS